MGNKKAAEMFRSRIVGEGELRPSELLANPRNWRTHPKAQLDALRGLLTEVGWVQRVIVNRETGHIVDGHARVERARERNEPTVPVLYVALTPEEEGLVLAALDPIGGMAETDQAALDALLDGIGDVDERLQSFLDDLRADGEFEQTTGKTDEDDVPEVRPNAVTKAGDVWICGRHRVMCGDSTSASAVGGLMSGARADLVFTDPPYGMSYDGGRGKKNVGMIAGDGARGEDLISLVRGALASARSFCKEGSAAYVCFPWRTYAQFELALQESGLSISSCIVWDKKSIGLGHQDYRPQHEFIFYSKGGQFYGDRSESDVWYMSRGSTAEYVHPTQKPVELVERALSNSSKQGDLVIDCFGGSGSTLIACEKKGRDARLMELDPKYCDVIVRRWQDFTGLEAVLEADGAPFNSMTPAPQATKAKATA